MLADGRTVPDGEVVDTDVSIVGAGPAGITLARELSRAGLEVLLLERGEAERAAPPADQGTVVNLGLRYAIDSTRAFGFGGSIHEWLVQTPVGAGMGRLREFDEEDFERREWIPDSGWPFSKDELRPFYTRARELFDTTEIGIRSDDEWERSLECSRFTDGSMVVRTRLFTFANPAVFAADHRRQLENRDNVLVLTNSTVAALLNDGRSATGLRVVTEGGSFTVVAKKYVLAAGGLETARILLCSHTPGSHALGNAHDLVGRYFMEHPHFVSGLLEPHTPSLFRDVEHHSIHMREGIPVQRKYSLSDEVMRREGLPRCVFMFSPSRRDARLRLLTYSDAGTRAIHQSVDARQLLRTEGASLRTAKAGLAAARGAPHLLRYTANKAVVRAGERRGSAHYTQPAVFKIQAMAEQRPNPSSRLVLTRTRDAYGLPVAGLDWRLCDDDLEGYRRTQDLLTRALAGSGHQRVRSLLDGRALLPGLIGGCHHMGTTRMHPSPRRGVVDADSRLHEAPNVYVAGASVFPTSGYANPILTTLAMTLRLADHLRTEMR